MSLADLLHIPETLPVKRKAERVSKSRKGAPDERAVQQEIVRALRKLGLRVTAVPNGAHLAGDQRRRERQMAALKLDGLESGFPDLILMRPIHKGGPDFGLLEIKREGGVLSIEQIDMRDRCGRDGIKWGVAWSLDTALAVLQRWGWLR